VAVVGQHGGIFAVFCWRIWVLLLGDFVSVAAGALDARGIPVPWIARNREPRVVRRAMVSGGIIVTLADDFLDLRGPLD